jgi:hypothetical protein
MSETTPGQRFRDAQPTLFGQAPPDWIVDTVFIGTDGKEYAQIHSSLDPHDRKTLSTAILGDKRRFTQIRLRPVA